MKANELRIGNYVWDEYSGTMHVKAIHNGLGLAKLGFDVIGLYNYRDIEPIKLTEEWLLQFGFKGIDYSKNIQYGHDLFWELTYYKESKTYRFDDLECIIKYIHQLQNLYFSLCGKELLIK